MSDKDDFAEVPPSASQPASSTRNKPDTIGYWRANRRLIAGLLVIWASVSLGCGILFVEPLNQRAIGNMPLGFWFAQQGSIYVFVVMIFVYAFWMDRLDRKYGVSDET